MQQFSTCDDVAASLRALRASVGQPSFGQIASTIGRMRVEGGTPAAVASPGRTTVYDAFRDGRRRIDAELVGEIVRALGVDEAEARQWETASRDVGRGAASTEAASVSTAARFVQIPVFPSRWQLVLAILVGSLALNLVGRALVWILHMELHLDMMGTAVGAILLGPWWGALVGLATNISGAAISGNSSYVFALVNIAGALLWGYGVRSRWGQTLVSYVGLNMVVAVVCTMVAAPIVLLLYGGEDRSAATTARIFELSHSMVVAVFSSNLLTSLADKLISGFVAVAVVEAVASRRRG